MRDFRYRLGRLMAGRLCVRHGRRWTCSRCGAVAQRPFLPPAQWDRLLALVARTGWRPQWERCDQCGQRRAACWECERERLAAAVQTTLSPAERAEYAALRRACLRGPPPP